MATSRAESQHSQYGRRRSNTAQSVLRTLQVPSLKVGDHKVLNSWVHEKDTPQILFNHSWWPGVAEGDLIRVSGPTETSTSFLFTVPKEDTFAKPQLQISIPQPIADSCGLRNNVEVLLTKVDKGNCSADYVEFTFQDQYLGRNDMWRLGEQLVGQCIHTNQEVTFIGSIAAKIHCIYIGGQKVSSACMTSTTKSIFRSLSAKVTIFIQVCNELWEFAGDGERYNEKIVHSFLPALFAKWREAGTNHTVSIVLISRVFYDQSEIGYAAGPLRRDDLGRWYKDFFKVITDLEVIYDWKPTLVILKESFWDFQRDILLTHHYHRAHQDASVGPSDQVRLVGRLSKAQDGPLLEALNLALNPTEHHYIDRSLSLTGVASMVITPGTGFYRVSRQLLRLTTTRMLDQGFGLDLVSLAKPPLHQVPVFCFERPDQPGTLSIDPLWGPDDDSRSGKTKTSWWEPFWISISFWDRQMDLPFREDRFVARAKMHQIQMLGLLEHDVLSSIEVPFLDPQSIHQDPTDDARISKEEADQFDADVFSFSSDSKSSNPNRQSLTSSTGSLLIATPQRPAEKRNTMTHRNSLMMGSRIAPIEESPRRSTVDLPSPTRAEVSPATTANGGLSTSPSRLSIHSVSSNLSDRSISRGPRSQVPRQSSLASKLAPAWLFNPFRSNPSEPQTSQVSAQASPTGSAKLNLTTATPPSSSPVRVPTMSRPIVGQIQSPLPMAIKNTPGNRSHMSRTFEEETYIPGRTAQVRRSPINTPPFDESQLSKRWSIGTVNLSVTNSSSSPGNVIDPSRPKLLVPAAQASLARRWQHMFPKVMYKHDIKWTSMVMPGCLPLTAEYFPTTAELESCYDVFSYDFVVDPGEMRSFLVKPPNVRGTVEEVRRAWALVVMRGMAAVRLAQGFQFVLRSRTKAGSESYEEKPGFRRTKSFNPGDEHLPKPAGPAEVLKSTTDPVYLSMSNEIHRISYTGEAIQVRRYVKRVPATPEFKYQCLIWPKLGGGYTEVTTTFASHGLEDYGWNRLDMLVAGYEHHFNESLRYWRTRFIVIPTSEPPQTHSGPSGEVLNDEEMRILGMERLAEQFSRLRWLSPDDKAAQAIHGPPPPVRLLPTTLGPAASVMDESLLEQLDMIHAAGPLRKKMKSEKEICDMPLNHIAKAMREDDGVPIKYNQWHRSKYPNSFTGYDFVSWVVREFRDISSRAQGVECGAKLLEQGLFEHCRGQHGFLDGHYYYRFKGEYAVPMTPKGWFRRYTPGDDNLRAGSSSNVARSKNVSPRKVKKRCILSQSMVIDIDPNKKSDQAESVILHHDITHNPATVFHFELQWIGTTARCIEDLLRQWNRTIERYGLRLVEAYVTQISDVRTRNAFQSCFPLRLVVPPPIVPDLDKRVPEGTLTTKYFEYAILRRFGFIIDVEAVELYPEQIDVVYSYRRSPFKYSQFVHRTGVAFVQVLGGTDGFLFLTNRLMGPGRLGTTTKRDHPAAAAADEIRVKLQQFCSDKAALEEFYESEVASLLPPVPEDPPPLVI